MLEMVIDMFQKDLNFTLIIFEIALTSIMAFVAVLSFNKNKKISTFFIILTAISLYIEMIFRILEYSQIFYISEIKYLGINIVERLLSFITIIFLIISLILMEKK